MGPSANTSSGRPPRSCVPRIWVILSMLAWCMVCIQRHSTWAAKLFSVQISRLEPSICFSTLLVGIYTVVLAALT